MKYTSIIDYSYLQKAQQAVRLVEDIRVTYLEKSHLQNKNRRDKIK